MTTANGDGIEFNPFLGSIFDEIEHIKAEFIDPQSGKKKPILPPEESMIKMEDIPPNLRPSSLLLETTRTLEDVKDYVQELNLKEEELVSLIRGLKYDRPVRSVNTSLNLLILRYKDAVESQNSLQDRIDRLCSEKQLLMEEINESKIQNEKDHNTIDELRAEVSYYQDEHKKLNLMFEKNKRQIEENDSMKQSENMKLLFDSQNYKEKIEKLKHELYDVKKKLGEMEKYESLYLELQQKFNENESEQIKTKIEKQQKLMKQNQSLIGHIKGSPSIFSQETCLFLDVNDILKISFLSKKVQGVFLKYNSEMILTQLNLRFYQLKSLNDDLQRKLSRQDLIIKRYEEKDNIRQLIGSDTGEEKMRQIIEKHVVKRAIENKSRGDYQNELLKETNSTINQVTQFIGSYFELLQIYQQKMKEQEALGQQQHQQVHSKQGSASGSSHQREQFEQQLPQPMVDTRLIQTGKKLVNSFGFGFLKKKQKGSELANEAVPPQKENNDIQNQVLAQIPNQEQHQQSSHINEEQAQEVPERKQSDDILTSTTEITSEEEFKKEIIEEENKQETLVEENKPSEQQKQESLIGLTKQKGPSKESEPFKVMDQTLMDLKNSNSIEEMNQVLYRIGSFLLSDKKKLSNWIAGIQQGFVELYILVKNIYQDFSELELLKDFLVQRVEALKLKVFELLNEKEDMIAIHQSDVNIKEYLKGKLNEAERTSVEKGTELLMERSKIEDLVFTKEDSERRMKEMESEVVEWKGKYQKEIKHLKEKMGRLNEENQAYLNAIEDMRKFFNKVNGN